MISRKIHRDHQPLTVLQHRIPIITCFARAGLTPGLESAGNQNRKMFCPLSTETASDNIIFIEVTLSKEG
jgi:hypothetical protein